MGPERKISVFQHVMPLHVMPGAWKRKKAYARTGLLQAWYLEQVQTFGWHSWRVQHSQLETDFFKRTEIPFGQQTQHPGFQNRAPHAGSEHI